MAQARRLQQRKDNELRTNRYKSLRPRLRTFACAGSGAIEKKFTFARVARKRGRALKLCLRLGEPAELEKKVPSNARQEVVGLERRLRNERINDFQTRCWTMCHGYS